MSPVLSPCLQFPFSNLKKKKISHDLDTLATGSASHAGTILQFILQFTTTFPFLESAWTLTVYQRKFNCAAEGKAFTACFSNMKKEEKDEVILD